MSFKTIKIDGVDYQAEAPVITAFTRLKEENEKLKSDSSGELESLRKDSSTLHAENDQLKEENVKLKKDVEDARAKGPEDIEKAVRSRMVVLDAAKRSGIEIKSDMSEEDIKKAVVISLYPSSKEKMDTADEVYVNARFEGALERLDEISEEKGQVDNSLSADSIARKDEKDKDTGADAAYERMMKRDQEAYKRGQED